MVIRDILVIAAIVLGAIIWFIVQRLKKRASKSVPARYAMSTNAKNIAVVACIVSSIAWALFMDGTGFSYGMSRPNLFILALILGVFSGIGSAIFEDFSKTTEKLSIAFFCCIGLACAFYFGETGYNWSNGRNYPITNGFVALLWGIIGSLSLGCGISAICGYFLWIKNRLQISSDTPEPQNKFDKQTHSAIGGDEAVNRTFDYDPNRFQNNIRTEKQESPPEKTVTPKRKPRKKPAPKALAAIEELNAMIGLEPVKEQITRLRAKIIFDQKRKAAGAAATSQSMHMVFTGNPGTGKTTVARIIGKIFHELGVLKKPTVHEVAREDLVAEYVGQTAPKTTAEIKKARNGVLFIDEAYSLSAAGNSKDFGREAIETLLKEMENNRDSMVVIVAGYKKEMQTFLKSNPGLKSRFKNLIDFPDYTPPEMYQIFEKIASEQDFKLAPAASTLLFHHLAELHKHRDTHFGNGRDVRNLLESCVSNLAIRTQDEGKIDAKNLSTITATDIPVPDTLKSNSKMIKLWAFIQDANTNAKERQQAIDQLNKENEKLGQKRLSSHSQSR